ncbi:MAG: sugar ABC transporter permease [Bacilli bacterium]|nr:sugar ABC transporter permease [Bacilli bacterium]
MRTVDSVDFTRKRKKKSADRRHDLITYICFMIWPVLQFVVFYIFVNANSLLLAFQENVSGTQFTFASNPFANIGLAFKDFFGPKWGPYLVGSMSMFAITCLVGTPLGLFFSYYIYKKLPLSTFFRVMLFLPSIISATVLAIMFRYFMNYAVPHIVTSIFGPGALPEDFTGYFSEYPFFTVCFFNLFIGFGTSVLMYANTMSGIDPSIIEAARVDGATPLREFFSIVLPHVYPTFVVFFITGIGTMFVNQFNVMTFFGWEGNSQVLIFGYQLFARAATKDWTEYPYLASLGIVVSIIVIPVTLVLRKVLLKYGPSED